MNQELREIHAAWLRRKEEGEQGNPTAPEIPEEVETPVAFPPQDLPSPILQDIESLSTLYDVESSTDAFADDRTASSSPTLTVSTISDLAPTELGDDIEEDRDEHIYNRHDTFYLEDGNVEILCGHITFRIHSPVVAFSSPTLRDMLSPSVILNAPMPRGCPRVVFKDEANDFAVLLKMIYTPGYVPIIESGAVN